MEGPDSFKEIRTYKLSERFPLRAENKFRVRDSDKDALLSTVRVTNSCRRVPPHSSRTGTNMSHLASRANFVITKRRAEIVKFDHIRHFHPVTLQLIHPLFNAFI
jgi:hypothetical protein